MQRVKNFVWLDCNEGACKDQWVIIDSYLNVSGILQLNLNLIRSFLAIEGERDFENDETRFRSFTMNMSRVV